MCVKERNSGFVRLFTGQLLAVQTIRPRSRIHQALDAWWLKSTSPHMRNRHWQYVTKCYGMVETSRVWTDIRRSLISQCFTRSIYELLVMLINALLLCVSVDSALVHGVILTSVQVQNVCSWMRRRKTRMCELNLWDQSTKGLRGEEEGRGGIDKKKLQYSPLTLKGAICKNRPTF